MIENETIVKIKIEELIPNKFQPRKVFNDESINELALSIKQYGVLNPVLVRKSNDKYEIIAGERRVRASKLAGLTEIPAIIKKVEDKEMAELALIENIQRENITPIEEAKAYEQILNNTNITEEKLSEMVGKSQPFISNKLRLLTLPQEVQDAVINKKISEKHARTLLIEKDVEKQKELLKKIITEKMSVRELERILKEKKELEKESDNMNNGSFFPNFNNNVTPMNTNLNVTNQQPIPGTPPAVEITPMTYTPQPENNEEPIVMPTQVAQQIESEPAPTPMPSPEMSINNIQPILPNQNIQPIEFNQTMEPEPVQNPIPLNESMPSLQQPQPTLESMNEIPLFASQNNVPIEESNPVSPGIEQNSQILEPAISVPQPSIEETPLFPENNQPSLNIPSIEDDDDDDDDEEEDMELNKYYQVKNFLEDNDIPYKAYTNEINNCIIIEF